MDGRHPNIVEKHGKLHVRIRYRDVSGRRRAVWRRITHESEAPDMVRTMLTSVTVNASRTAAAARRDDNPGQVYALTVEIPGVKDPPIKLGYSTNLPQRLACFTTYCPYPVSLLGAWKASHRERDERSFIKEFENDRIRGEWFTPSEGLYRYIEQRVAADGSATSSMKRLKRKDQRR